jgi:hypothetical protein
VIILENSVTGLKLRNYMQSKREGSKISAASEKKKTPLARVKV